MTTQQLVERAIAKATLNSAAYALVESLAAVHHGDWAVAREALIACEIMLNRGIRELEIERASGFAS